MRIAIGSALRGRALVLFVTMWIVLPAGSPARDGLAQVRRGSPPSFLDFLLGLQSSFETAFDLNGDGQVDTADVVSNVVSPNGWAPLGGLIPFAVPYATVRPGLALDASGRPTVVWEDRSSWDSRVYLAQWNGQSWGELGGSASGNGVAVSTYDLEPALAVTASDGHPTVAWNSEVGGEETAVHLKQWNGSAWIELAGSATGNGISDLFAHNSDWSDNASGPAVAVNSFGQPFVAWSDDDEDDDQQIYLRRWTGSAWSGIGTSASGGGVSGGSDYDSNVPVLRLDAGGGPVLGWMDWNWDVEGDGYYYSIYVKKWNGSAWVGFGASGSGLGVAGLVDSWDGAFAMALDPMGHPIVAWEDSSGSGDTERVFLKRWNGSAWVELGGSASGDGVRVKPLDSYSPSLAVTSAGHPVLAVSIDNAIELVHWNGSQWVSMGNPNPGVMNYLGSTEPLMDLAVDGMDRAIVAWEDLDGLGVARCNRPMPW